MGITNTRHNLERIVAIAKGEKATIEAQIAQIEAGIEELRLLRARWHEVNDDIVAAERLVRRTNPDWSSDSIPAIRKANRHSPVPYGSLGRTALDVLREGPPDGMRTRAVAEEVLRRFKQDVTDRRLLDAKSNSLGQFFKANEGDLVESDGERLFKRWRLIRSK